MRSEKRRLKDTLHDPSVVKRRRTGPGRKPRPALRLALAVLIGFFGGFSAAKLFRF